MELKEGTPVFSADGKEVGKINRFVMNPVSKKMTHVVVQKGFLFPEDKVVPIDLIVSSEPDRATLSANAEEIQDLPPFQEMHYVNLDDAENQRLEDEMVANAQYYYWYPPFATPGYAYPYFPSNAAIKTEQNIPTNTIALEEGADVLSVDGKHIADVERVFTDPENGRVTHFLISKGLLIKERKLIPVDWISEMDENTVHLAVSEMLVDRLPDYED